MTEIVERLERQAVNVENDGHVSAARAMRDAANALTEARAEIERLRAAMVESHKAQSNTFEACRDLELRAIAAESELSTLRARVREVVGLGLDVISEERGWGTYPRMEGSEIYTDADVFSRAARQLMEEVKDA